MRKYNIVAVSYLNTKPLLYGLFKTGLEERIRLRLEIPSKCADLLISGEADMGLVPVATIPHLSTPKIMSEFCIGSTGPVKTVCVAGDVPVEKMETIYLDFHSRTSVELVKLLLKDHWKVNPKLVHAHQGFESKIQGKIGGLIIGDRAIGLDEEYEYVYDLGAVWDQYANLPFVFAAWISNNEIEEDFLEDFNRAMAVGIDYIPQLMYLMPRPNPNFDLEAYFMQNISYQLDEEKQKGLTKFLTHLGVTRIPEFRKGKLNV